MTTKDKNKWLINNGSFFTTALNGKILASWYPVHNTGGYTFTGTGKNRKDAVRSVFSHIKDTLFIICNGDV